MNDATASKRKTRKPDDVIHFDATQQFFFGFEYWNAYLRAMRLTVPVSSAQTANCPGAIIQSNVTQCG